MKFLFPSILIAVIFFISVPGYGQKNIDSLPARAVKSMQIKLKLTDSVANLLLTALTNRVQQIKNIDDKLSPEDRKAALRRIAGNYYSQVKVFLTPEQWAQYQQIEAATRQKFKNRMKSKKVQVKELE